MRGEATTCRRGSRVLGSRRWYTETFAPRQLLLRTALVSKLLSLSSPLSSLPAGIALWFPAGFFVWEAPHWSAVRSPKVGYPVVGILKKAEKNVVAND